MTDLPQRIKAFHQLGQFLRMLIDHQMKPLNPQELAQWHTPVEEVQEIQGQLLDYYEHAHHYNPWFTQEFIRLALEDWSQALSSCKLEEWTQPYQFTEKQKFKRVGVVMAGNLPLVGFHDYLSVLISGHQLIAKLSSDVSHLLPLLNQLLALKAPDLAKQAEFTKDQLKNFDAVIATGSNNTARYFEYYFGKYPHIIRKNRNGIAIITGQESLTELKELAKDVMSYFGLGCRSVSKIYLPRDYNFKPLLEAFNDFSHFQYHSKYYNNYEYNKAIFLVNKVMHRDNGFLLLREETSFSSSISVLHYENYESLEQLHQELKIRKDEIQCIIGDSEEYFNFGEGQHPALNDYADGVDTLKFLNELV